MKRFLNRLKKVKSSVKNKNIKSCYKRFKGEFVKNTSREALVYFS